MWARYRRSKILSRRRIAYPYIHARRECQVLAGSSIRGSCGKSTSKRGRWCCCAHVNVFVCRSNTTRVHLPQPPHDVCTRTPPYGTLARSHLWTRSTPSWRRASGRCSSSRRASRPQASPPWARDCPGRVFRFKVGAAQPLEALKYPIYPGRVRLHISHIGTRHQPPHVFTITTYFVRERRGVKSGLRGETTLVLNPENHFRSAIIKLATARHQSRAQRS
jgi:hypothetical protein